MKKFILKKVYFLVKIPHLHVSITKRATRRFYFKFAIIQANTFGIMFKTVFNSLLVQLFMLFGNDTADFNISKR